MKQPPSETVVEFGGRKFAKNLTILAAQLGIGLRTIKTFNKASDKPLQNSKGYYDIELWREWVATRPMPNAARRSVQVDLSSEERHESALRKQRLEEQRLEEQVKKLIIEREEMEGSLVSLDEAIRVFCDLASAVKDTQAAMCHNIARDMAGCDVPEATKRIRDASRRVLEKLALGEWAKKKAFWSRLYAMQFDQLGISPRGSGESDIALTP